MSGTILILISAVFHALWNTLVKGTSEPRRRLIPILVSAAFFSPLITFISLDASIGRPGSWGWVLGSGICEAGYMICLGFTLERGPLGLTYIIMRGGAMIVVWFISTLFLGESFHFFSGVGLLLILCGLALCQIESIKERRSESFFWALGAAFFIAGYHLCYGQALRFGMSAGVLFSISLWISVPLLELASGKVILQDSWKEVKNAPSKIIFGGVICSLSFILFLQGLKAIAPGEAISLRNTSIVFAQGFALTLGEKIAVEQWVGSFLVLLGAMLTA